MASSVDRQSKAGVNFRHTTRRCLRMTYDLRLAGNDHAGGNPPCPRARSVQCRRFRARMRGRRTLPSPLADACRRRCAIGHSGIGRDDARRCARDLVVRPARRPALRSKRIRICSDTRPARLSPTKGWTPGPCKGTSSIGTSRTPCVTRNSRRAASRTSGKIEDQGQAGARQGRL